MRFFHWILFGMCSLAGGCHLATAQGVSSKAIRGWHTYNVDVRERIVRFSVPGGESKDYPSFQVPFRLDLNKASIDDRLEGGLFLLRRFWDYRTSGFVQPAGTMSAVIAIYPSNEELVDAQALKAAVQATSKRFADKSSAVLEAQDTPLVFQPITISGRQWLQVTYRLSGTVDVTRLDNKHYLLASIDPTGVSGNPEWRRSADATADMILKSIEIVDLDDVQGAE